MVHHGRMNRKDALYSLAKTDLAHRHGLAQPGILPGNDGSFKSLQAFVVAFLDLDVDANRIAGTKLRQFGRLVFGYYFAQQGVGNGGKSFEFSIVVDPGGFVQSFRALPVAASAGSLRDCRRRALPAPSSRGNRRAACIAGNPASPLLRTTP